MHVHNVAGKVENNANEHRPVEKIESRQGNNEKYKEIVEIGDIAKHPVVMVVGVGFCKAVLPD